MRWSLPGQNGAWTPIGVEQTAGGYEVAWKMGADQYIVWATDGSGAYVSTMVGPVSGGNIGLQSLAQPLAEPGRSDVRHERRVANIEAGFQQDLNGDGSILIGW